MGRYEIPIEATIESGPGHFILTLSASRAALFVEIRDEAFASAENWFHLAPGRPKRVVLTRRVGTAPETKPQGTIHAVNRAAPRGFSA